MKREQSGWSLGRVGHTPTELLILLVLAGIWMAAAIPLTYRLADPEDAALALVVALVGGVAIVAVGWLAIYSETRSGCIAAAGNLLVVPAAFLLASGADAPGRLVFWLAAPAAWNALALVSLVVEVGWSLAARRSE